MTAVKEVCEQKSPALAMMSEKHDPKQTEGTADADLAKARKDIGKGLKELMDRIENAVPLVGSKIDYEDLVPIHTQLFAGGKGASGQNWSDPVEQAVAKQYVKKADAERLLASLGLGALSAAAFILAPFTGGATLVALLAVGVGASAANAAMSWNRWDKLSTAAAATGVSPKYAIISKEQADSALITAIIDTAFALIDIAGATKALKAGAAARELLKAAEAGAKEAAEQGLKDLAKGIGGAAAVEKAVLELGPQEASRISGKSFEQLAEIAGKDTETGAKLMKFAELGPEGAAKAATDAVEAMKNLKSLDKVAANEAVMHSIDNLGYVGTIKQGGGWKEVTKVVGEGSAAATKLEALACGHPRGAPEVPPGRGEGSGVEGGPDRHREGDERHGRPGRRRRGGAERREVGDVARQAARSRERPAEERARRDDLRRPDQGAPLRRDQGAHRGRPGFHRGVAGGAREAPDLRRPARRGRGEGGREAREADRRGGRAERRRRSEGVQAVHRGRAVGASRRRSTGW